MLGHPTRLPYFGIIVDGLHSHPNTVRIAYNACKEGCVLVSDGGYLIISSIDHYMGLLLTVEWHTLAQSIMDPSQSDGVIDWRPGLRFRKEGLKVLVDGTSTLAGSAAPLAPLAYNLSKFASISLPMALLCATKQAAECLGGEVAKHKGQLIEGFDADLCVFDWEGNVKNVWIMGEEIWKDGEGWVDGRGDGP